MGVAISFRELNDHFYGNLKLIQMKNLGRALIPDYFTPEYKIKPYPLYPSDLLTVQEGYSEEISNFVILQKQVYFLG